MPRTIEVFVINLARRPDRLERIAEHLKNRAVLWHRIDAVDVNTVEPQTLNATIGKSGPLGVLGDADRACTCSHFKAWQAFLQSDATHALFLEDDVFVSHDLATLLRSSDWITPEMDVIKLEKFGDGTSKVLLGKTNLDLPVTRQAFRMFSCHVGGGAYILSRKAARAALEKKGQISVPIDHFLFNPNVSMLSRQLKPLIIQPAMATQRAYAYNSDIAGMGKAAKPKGWRLVRQKIVRGYHELNLLPKQFLIMVTGGAKWLNIYFKDKVND